MEKTLTYFKVVESNDPSVTDNLSEEMHDEQSKTLNHTVGDAR